MQNNTKVERLIVADNYIKEDGAKALAEMLQDNMYIRELVSNIFCVSSLIITDEDKTDSYAHSL